MARTGGGRTAAYCNVWVVDDAVQVNSLATRPPERRRDLAGTLVNHALAIGGTCGAGRATLEVRASNKGCPTAERLACTRRSVRRACNTSPREEAPVLGGN